MRRLLIAIISVLLASVAVLPQPVGAVPSSVNVTANGSGVLDITWTASGDGTVVDYLIEADQGAGALFSDTVAAPATSGSLTGLGNNETYTITVTARDAGQVTVGSPATGSGTTETLAPSGATVALSSVTSSSMVATFSADAGGGSNTYTLTVREDAIDGAVFDTTVGAVSPESITGLDPGRTYFVVVSADNGVAPAASASDSATTSAVAPSGATVALSSVTSSSMVATFSADAGGGSNTYTLTVREDAIDGAVFDTTVGAVSPESITGLDPGRTYFVVVSADNGVAPAASASDSATTSAVAPSVPQNVVATLSSDDVVVTWDAPASDGGSALTGYEVSVNGGAAQSVAVSPRSFTVSNPGPATDVTVSIVAVNAAGSSGAATSNTVTTDVAAPVISSLTVTADGSAAIDVAWAASDGGGTNSYTTSISPNDGSGGVSGSAATSTRYTGLTPGQSYTVTLTATNSASSDSDSGSATTSAVAATAPREVTAELAGAVDDFVTVRWLVPSNNGGSTITGYEVRLSNGDSVVINDSSARSTTFENVAADTSVSAQVRAITGAGDGAFSGASNSVRTSNFPGQVQNLSATWAGSENINSIDVNWDVPSNDGRLALTGYVVTVSPEIENDVPVVDPDETSVTIGGLDQGQTYTVTVRAQNGRGNGASVTSSAVLVPSTPGTVTDLVVTQSPPFSSGVVLTWALPESDGGSPISGFSIVVDDREPLVVGADVTTASFADLPVGDHNVTVRAITAAGLGSVVTSPNFEVKGFAPFDSEEDFVTQLYADFLRRTPDAGGLAFWTERVANDGSNVQDIIEAFMRSPEFSPRRSVARLYFAYFNRQPDKGGFDFWTQQIASGAATIETASQAFALSPEFIAATQIEDPQGSGNFRPLTDGEYIVFVYNAVLDRRPDTGGFRFWLDQLANGLDRGTLMTLFSESPENLPLSRPAVDVTVTYDGLLQREADVEGFLFWTDRVSQLDTGLTELIRQFYFSEEYADRVNR